jgi:hypothetical protein
MYEPFLMHIDNTLHDLRDDLADLVFRKRRVEVAAEITPLVVFHGDKYRGVVLEPTM